MSEPTEGAPPPAPTPEPSSWQAPPPAQVAPAAVVSGPAPGVSYAETTTRVIAYILDALLFFVVGVVIVSVLILAIFSGSGIVGLIGSLLLAAVSLIGSAVYFVYTWTRMRGSLGQRALGLETVNAADGATLT
ncbi:MAG: RDD family protein, partial [Candidatus Limnocylindrales bacterium]